MPKISIIVPIYRVEKYLRECLDSILSQTFTDMEILLIDDGGKDECPQIIDEYAKKDSRIVAIHKQNGGYGQSCNVGLERATGEYISIIEPDDYIDSKMFEDLYNIAKQYNSDIVKSGFYDNLQSKEKVCCKQVEWNDFIPEDKSFTIKEYPYFLHYHPSIWSCIYKKEFLNKHNIRFVEAPGAGWTDNPFQVQTMCLAERINYTSDAYYYWRRVNENESEDLKDWTIPFKRSDEIHKWLDENNISDKNCLAALYMRELAYIQIVLGKNYSKEEIRDVFSEIEKMTSRMDMDIIQNCSFMKKRLKKSLILAKTNLSKFYKNLSFKKFRQNLFSIRWNKEEKRIKILGLKYYIKKYMISSPINYYNLCFACNERYVQHLCSTLKSIFVNKNPNENFNIVILNENIKPRTKRYIELILPQNSKIKFIDVNNEVFKNCPLTIDTFHINSLTTYYRFILPEICDFDKVLYLDCDTIVNKSLSGLYKTNINNYYIAGVIDSYEKENCERLSLNKYVNAGVLLINLDLWRKDNVTQRLFDWTINNQDKIKWQDQDVLNVVLQEKILYLPEEYNAQVSKLEFGNTKEFNKIGYNATIIHYVGHLKPWNDIEFNFGLNNYYWKYLFKLNRFYIRKILFLINQLFNLRKKIIKIRFNSKEKSIYILGNKII